MMTGWNVDPSGRFLQRNGEPWFMVGDTAWELFRRLTNDEVDHYVRTRARQGFNTVLAVAFGCRAFDGLRTPSIEGDLPFSDHDPARPNEPYWQHVDWTIRRANSHGLVVGLLPCWGHYWHGSRDGKEPPLFNTSTAAAYATWLAERYAESDVIWVLGGDFPVSTNEHRATVDAFAVSIRRVVGRDQLITFHPEAGFSSSDFLPHAEWIDFNMIQSGHRGWQIPNYQLVEQDSGRQPAKPTLDGEPNYDSHPVMDMAWKPVPGHYFDEHDVRRAAYHAVFAGACGHVYGCDEVWQMYNPERGERVIGGGVPAKGAGSDWKTALERPGAHQMGHLAALMRETGLSDWEPAQELIARAHGILGRHQRAVANRRTPAALIYAPAGRDVAVDLDRWPGRSWIARWWNPRRGRWDNSTGNLHGDQFITPHPFPGLDGVLLLTENDATSASRLLGEDG